MPKKETVIIKTINPKFSNKEQLLVVKAVLMGININLKRSKKVDLKIRGLGKIHTHGNTHSSNKKYETKYNKEQWKKKKKELEFSIKKLLF